MLKQISKPFVDDTTGDIRPYTGVVSDLFFSRSDGTFSFHIDYDDDDDEDMECWELKKYMILNNNKVIMLVPQYGVEYSIICTPYTQVGGS